jgi:hypothetical protein
MTIADTRLFKTANGGRLHIAECPYILGAEVFLASPADLDALPVCSWCDAELNDEGRTYHDTIEDALRDMGAPEVSIPQLRSLLAGRPHDTIYVPFSRSYVAVAFEGRPTAVAGKTYVWFGHGDKVELPGYVESHSSTWRKRSQVWGALCPITYLRHPVNGACEWCQ